jgi:D-glycero-alpha-D-manno-heptose 1-phosphate guanylyltransferase
MAAPVLARDCDVVILAGGLGTRLRSVLPDCQKVLAPVGDEPFVFHLFRLLAVHGIARAVLALGHRAEDVQACLPDWRTRFGIDFSASIEATPLGTGGAVRHALAHCQRQQILVMNGDSWVGVDLDRMLARHTETAALATLATVHVDDAGRYGSLDWSEDSGRVAGFAEKSSASAGQPDWINAGIYALQRSCIESLPPVSAGQSLSLERDLLPHLAGKGLFAFAADGPFIDIGLPETYNRSQAFFAGITANTATPDPPEPPPCR